MTAEEAPELSACPKDCEYLAGLGPRGMLHGFPTDVDDDRVDRRFGRIGRQVMEDTGARTPKRMETTADQTRAAAIDFMQRAHAAGQPFVFW
jgi:arylsulfatase